MSSGAVCCPGCGVYFGPITTDDLAVMQQVGVDEFRRFVANSRYAVYSDRLVLIALCQGAAQHYYGGGNGVKDVDLWLFFEEHPLVKIPHRGNCKRSMSVTFPAMGVRRVDLMKKMIPAKFVVPGDPVKTVRSYLTGSQNATPVHLSRKPVLGLYPGSWFLLRVL
ncbi:MAG: hypothetical protein AB1609_11165 [Bacillota bacterium]